MFSSTLQKVVLVPIIFIESLVIEKIEWHASDIMHGGSFRRKTLFQTWWLLSECSYHPGEIKNDFPVRSDPAGDDAMVPMSKQA